MLKETDKAFHCNINMNSVYQPLYLWNTYIIYLGLHTYFYFTGLWLKNVFQWCPDTFCLFVPEDSWLVMDDFENEGKKNRKD